MQIKVRPADVNDMNQIFELVKKFATSFTPNQKDFDTSFKKIINTDHALLLVALSNEVVIGYLLGFEHFTFYANGRVGWIEEIMVAEEFRRQRIGKKLMDEFEKWIEQKNGKLIGLATRRAADFYKAIGYEESALFFRKIMNKE